MKIDLKAKEELILQNICVSCIIKYLRELQKKSQKNIKNLIVILKIYMKDGEDLVDAQILEIKRKFRNLYIILLYL
jgi:hypothetical protein